MTEDIVVKVVTKNVLTGFKKSIKRIQSQLKRDFKNVSLKFRLEKVGGCCYCHQLFKLGDKFIEQGHEIF